MPHSQKTLEALNALKYELPLCFKQGKKKKPIALGIHKEIFVFYANDLRFSKTNLRQALRLYTSATEYLKNVKEGVSRIDLYGKQTTFVTKEEQQNAALSLLRKKERHLKRTIQSC